MNYLGDRQSTLWYPSQSGEEPIPGGMITYANRQYFQVYLRIWTRHTQEALFTTQLGDGTYFGVSAFMACSDPLPISPASTMRAADEEPMTRARGDGRATEIITIPDSPAPYDNRVIRSMVCELDELNIPSSNVMISPDQLSPLDSYLNDLELETGALGPPTLQQEEEDDAMSSGMMVEDEEPFAAPSIGGVLSMPTLVPPLPQHTCWPLAFTPGQETLDYSPTSVTEISAPPTPSPLPPTPPTPCLTLEDVTPEGSPTEGSLHSGRLHSESETFSPATEAWDTLDSWETPGYGFDI